MLSMLLLAALAAPPSAVVVPFESTGLDERLVTAWTERFALLLHDHGRVKVVTQGDVTQLLGMERQRQLLGCSSETSCLTELVGALGADFVVRGSFVKSEAGFTLALKVLRARDARLVASNTTRAETERDAVAWLEDTALAFADVLAPDTRPAALPGWVRWVPALGGLALGGVSAGFFVADLGAQQTLQTNTTLTQQQIRELSQQGQTAEALGVGFAIGAGVALGTSVVWALAAPGPRPTVSVAITPVRQGAVFGVGGNF